MQKLMPTFAPALGAVLAGSSFATVAAAATGDVQLTIELPRLPVAEYHKPYVAIWLEKPGSNVAATQLALWYDVKKPRNGGAKYLRDMRQWWHAGGSELSLPVDGISGATRAPGEQAIALGPQLAKAALPAGEYEVVVEVAREAGGREVKRLPLSWPIKAAAVQHAQGDHEVGRIDLEVKP